MYLDEKAVIKVRKIRILIIVIYSIIILLSSFIYPLIKGNFKISINFFVNLGMMIFFLFTFYKGNKFSGYILMYGLIFSIGILPVRMLHYFNMDNILGGALYIIIPVLCCILTINTDIYNDFINFMELQHRKRNKGIYYLENIILIIMIVVDKII
ncbi:hypothetical protein [Caloranaerobacter sp. DY30410]|uniref:hypothetical protein n=1 Tax=Caloranaerobacter sp. DY30410 TaxID=3238305 RepID=UPI003D02650E